MSVLVDAVQRSAARPELVVRPSFRRGLPLNLTLIALGAFWLALATVAALNSHLLWTILSCLIGFAFVASVLLFHRNARIWADDSWAGKTDILGRRSACARSELGSVESLGGMTRRIRFLRRDGRLAFEINAYGWPPAELRRFCAALGLEF